MTPEQIKSLRLALGLSQDEFAEKLGYDGPHAHQTVSKLELGIKAPSGPVRRLLEIMSRDINK